LGLVKVSSCFIVIIITFLAQSKKETRYGSQHKLKVNFDIYSYSFVELYTKLIAYLPIVFHRYIDVT